MHSFARRASGITHIKVHLRNGPWNTQGGYEYNVALIAAVMALVDTGPGSLSIDRALGIEARGARWTLAALAAGAAGSTLAIEAGRRVAAAEERAAEEPNQGATGRFVRDGDTVDSEQVPQTA